MYVFRTTGCCGDWSCCSCSKRIDFDVCALQILTKLLTQDVPLLFVRPNKQIVNYLKGKTAGPLAKDFKDGIMLKGFAGELSITLLEGRKLSYFPIGILKSCISVSFM